jgi:hypothetical protein
MRGRACAFGIPTDAATPVVDPRNVVAAKAAIIEQIRMMVSPWRIVRMESIFDMRHFSQSTKRIDFLDDNPFLHRLFGAQGRPATCRSGNVQTPHRSGVKGFSVQAHFQTRREI